MPAFRLVTDNHGASGAAGAEWRCAIFVGQHVAPCIEGCYRAHKLSVAKDGAARRNFATVNRVKVYDLLRYCIAAIPVVSSAFERLDTYGLAVLDLLVAKPRRLEGLQAG